MLSAFMAFIEPGDEVIVFEPFFDQYISNIEMPGGKIVYVPMHPPKEGDSKTLSAGEWKIDFDELERAVTPRTKMLVINTPREEPPLPSSGPELTRARQPRRQGLLPRGVAENCRHLRQEPNHHPLGRGL